jgi:hypothetical protein
VKRHSAKRAATVRDAALELAERTGDLQMPLKLDTLIALMTIATGAMAFENRPIKRP